MELLRATLIHLVVPGAGLLLYLWLVWRMLDREIADPPVISLFIIFATWGSFLVLVLTRFFWYWSGMATLGLAYLFLLAPLVMTVIAFAVYRNRKLSLFHRGAFIASALYVPSIVVAFVSSSKWAIPFK